MTIIAAIGGDRKILVVDTMAGLTGQYESQLVYCGGSTANAGILWRWSTGISRWMSQPFRTSMNFVATGVGAGQVVSTPTNNTQIAYLPTPQNNDIYVYHTEIVYELSTSPATGNYWTYSDDHATCNTNLQAANTDLYGVINTASTITKNTRYRIVAAYTGSPGTLYTNSIVVQYVMLA